MGETTDLSSPELLGKGWAESPGRMLPSESFPKKTLGLGLGEWLLSLVLKQLCRVSPESLPTAGHAVNRVARISPFSSTLVAATKGSESMKSLHMLQGKWGQHSLHLILSPLPLIHRNSEIVESKGYRTRIFPLLIHYLLLKNERDNG